MTLPTVSVNYCSTWNWQRWTAIKKCIVRNEQTCYTSQLQLNLDYNTTDDPVATRISFKLLCDAPFTALGGDIDEFISDVRFQAWNNAKFMSRWPLCSTSTMRTRSPRPHFDVRKKSKKCTSSCKASTTGLISSASSTARWRRSIADFWRLFCCNSVTTKRFVERTLSPLRSTYKIWRATCTYRVQHMIFGVSWVRFSSGTSTQRLS